MPFPVGAMFVETELLLALPAPVKSVQFILLFILFHQKYRGNFAVFSLIQGVSEYSVPKEI